MKRYVIILLMLFLAINVNAAQPKNVPLWVILKGMTYLGYQDFYEMGEMLYALGKYDDAELAFKVSLSVASNTFGDESLEVIQPLVGLAMVYEGRSWYTKALTVWDRVDVLLEMLCPHDTLLSKLSKQRRDQVIEKRSKIKGNNQ